METINVSLTIVLRTLINGILYVKKMLQLISLKIPIHNFMDHLEVKDANLSSLKAILTA
jgi:hypothetical protein